MAKRDVPDFDPIVAFDKALAQQKPDLAARLGAAEGIAETADASEEPSPDDSGEPRLRIVPPEVASEKKPKRLGAPGKATLRRRGVVTRVSGKELRRLTVYVDLGVAQRLRTYCFDHELNLSDVAAQALELGLQRMLRG
jgi:hypothetical protein